MRRRGVKHSWLSEVGFLVVFLSQIVICEAQEPPSPPPPPPPVETNDAVVLNFEGADIREVIHSLATALGINYTIDPRVQGQITVRTTGKIARRDLFPVFHQILRSHGVAAVKVGDIYQIAPVGEAKTRTTLPLSTAERRRMATEDQFVVELVRIEYLAAEEMAKLLQPFVSPGGDVVAYPRANLVILTDLASSVDRLKRLVRAFDTDTFSDLNAQVYRIEHANVEDLGEELLGILAPYGVTPENAEERGVFIIPLARLNSIVVVSFNTDIFAEVEKWIQILDVPPERGGGRTVHIYPVENAKAADLAAILGDLYGGDGGGGGRRRERREGLSSRGGIGRGRGGRSGTEDGREGRTGGLGRGRQRGGREGLGREGRGGGGGQTVLITQQEGEKPIFKEDVRIVADEITNSLVILATPRDYAMIKDVLQKLDVVPRQVLIEAIIAEVGLTGDLQFGVEYAIANQGVDSLIGGRATDGGTDGGTNGSTSGGVRAGTNALDMGVDGNDLLQTSKRAVSVGGQGLFAFITDRDQFLIMLRALASRSRLDILATPHVLAADNREAHILIGEEIPILTSTATGLQAGDRTINSIQYRDTGKILTILPQVNSAGLVNMEIRQEVSDVGQPNFGSTNSPSFISRETETTVVVQNGESVVIGGIIDDQLSRSRIGIPFLMDVPVLGRLFRVERDQVDRTELIILITPYVVRDREEARAVTQEFESRIHNLRGMLDRVRQPRAKTPDTQEKGLPGETP